MWATLKESETGAALLHAALQSHKEKLRVLLELGADPNAVDEEGRNALHYAASSVSVVAAEFCALLIQLGVNVNGWDRQGLATPLICAAAMGNANVVRVLLKAGADVNAGLADARRPGAKTALHWATLARSLVCAQLLIDGGAAINSPQAYRCGQTC